MQSTSKIPPYWTPTLEKKGYPFSVWRRDIELWCAGAELPPHACGPAIAMRLGGIAREMVREVPTIVITQGRVDANGFAVAGPEVIVAGLARKFGQFDVEASIVAIIELLTFRRIGAESIDEAIARFEILKTRAGNNVANFDMPVAALA